MPDSKWITDLNVKHKTIKLLVKNIEEIFQDVGLGKKFLDLTPKVKSVKEKIDKLGFIKMMSFCSVKAICI